MNMSRISNLLKTMATSDSVNQSSREEALQVLLDQELANTITKPNLVANYFYSILVFGGIKTDTILLQEVMDCYTELTKFEVEKGYNKVNIGTEDDPVDVPLFLMEQIDHHVRHDEKITAIKIFRNHFGRGIMGLKNAKDIVEAYMKRNNIPYPKPKEGSNCENCNDKSCEKDAQVKDAPGFGVGFD